MTNYEKAVEYCNKQCNGYKGCGTCKIHIPCSAPISNPNEYRKFVGDAFIKLKNIG